MTPYADEPATNKLDSRAQSYLATVRQDLERIAKAAHYNPCAILGTRKHPPDSPLLLYSPDTLELSLEVSPESSPESSQEQPGHALPRVGDSDFFIYTGDLQALPRHYRVRRLDTQQRISRFHDPYSFPPQISDYDLHLFSEGRHFHIYNILGAHFRCIDGIDGIHFATWAPNAERVSVIGDFNHWDGRRHPMCSRGPSGVWELFIPGLPQGTLYKYEIRNRDSGAILTKTDPYSQQMELRPRTASVATQPPPHQWQDDAWMAARADREWLHEPLSIYECHLGSWQRDAEGRFLNYRELAHRLVAYLRETGFSHLQLMPITEHPLDASWGYQTTGYYAPTSRFGEANEFRYFVDYCHSHGIGVLLDWVPAHFPKDEHGLARFDGSALYEHEDPRRGEHRDWGTLIYNYGRNEVKNFLLASALYWLEEFHIDGLRVDAVASMLYLDYSRQEGDWLPNTHGGNENLEAIAFLRELNSVVHERFPGALMIAEESTAWPQVTRPVHLGGLGFGMKWNMGWMHDTLNYMQQDPIYRRYSHDQLTFGLLYIFTENFILPFSHDEVVHGKSSLLNKMPGDEWQRFANLRLLYTYMFSYPGKKLLFMGCEFAQGDEWDHDRTLDWYVLQYPLHQGARQLVSDLNRLYRSLPALHRYDFDHEGFEWIDCHDSDQSVLSYLRRAGDEHVLVVLNFTPVIRTGYRIGTPLASAYRVLFNSDSLHYAGSNAGSGEVVMAEETPWMGRPASLCLDLPPLAGLMLVTTT
ncbi:1,4-alpha-glucan branching protein GlgB [Sedimenticola hydrogenitrophicus]|uniref:1,4-alpha-glucan branching protein GlgB n=1 Tax=Sedimenticola hydrogenitrophicus TaxID=2967975 RepID=UPI003B5897DD